MVCKVKHFLFLLFALFSVLSQAQSNDIIKDSIEQCFVDVYQFKKQANVSRALEKLTKILDLSDSIQDKKSRAKAYMLRAELCIEQNYKSFDPAEIDSYLLRAQQIQEEINDSLGLGNNYVLRALKAIKNASYSNVDKDFSEAETIFKKNKFTRVYR